MDKRAFIEWIKEQRYVGKGFREGEQEMVTRLDATLDRFRAYLEHAHGITRFEDTSLDALRQFEFDLPANDDQHLRLVFSYLGRADLTDYIGMVSADKYFRNKKLPTVFKAMDDLKRHVRDLRKADVRLASELLERGATPEGRAALVEATDVPADALLQMVQCCDLCRMTGMIGKTLMRAVDMGYDTLAKFRAVAPEQIEAEFAAYLSAREERTNRMISFSSFVHQANRLQDVIVY
jgi:hypothetical protein